MKRSMETNRIEQRGSFNNLSDHSTNKFHREDTETNCLLTNARGYDGQFPYFRKPKEIGVFSKNHLRNFLHDKSQLKYYSPPVDRERSCKFDLSHGYSRMIVKDRNIKEYLNNLLRWIMHNKRAFSLQESTQGHPQKNTLFERLNTDFFCWRGLLTHVACLPYEGRDDLLIAVIKFRGSYYMCEFETEAKKRERENETPRQKEMCAWGFKFEQYVTSDEPNGMPNIDRPVNTNEEFGSVARSRLESHSLVYGAEVDCVDKNGNGEYVELKTSRIIEARRQHENFCKFKLIKWWAQSFLIGIPRVVCGFRDDNGVVLKLQDFPVAEMPAQAQSTLRNPWKPSVCLRFLDAFLQFVKKNVTDDNPRCVYLFRWKPGGDLFCENRGEDADFLFLPDWYLNWDAWDQPTTG